MMEWCAVSVCILSQTKRMCTKYIRRTEDDRTHVRKHVLDVGKTYVIYQIV